MKNMYILGIESSCDETSASIVMNGTKEIATVISSQIDVHKSYGGVVPEMLQRTAPSVAAGIVLHMIVGHYGLLFARGVSLVGVDQKVCG